MWKSQKVATWYGTVALNSDGYITSGTAAKTKTFSIRGQNVAELEEETLPAEGVIGNALGNLFGVNFQAVSFKSTYEWGV